LACLKSPGAAYLACGGTSIMPDKSVDEELASGSESGRAGAWGEEAESEILPTLRAGFAVLRGKD
jgi:hypothetical protein